MERGGDALVPGEDVEWLDDLAEGTAALDAWDYAFAQVLDTTLEAADEAGRRPASTWTWRATVSPWSWSCFSARGQEFSSRSCPRA